MTCSSQGFLILSWLWDYPSGLQWSADLSQAVGTAGESAIHLGTETTADDSVQLPRLAFPEQCSVSCGLCDDPLGSFWWEAPFQVFLFIPVTTSALGEYPFLYCRAAQRGELRCIFSVEQRVICQSNECCLKTALARSLVLTQLWQLTRRQAFFFLNVLITFLL